jgi:mannose-6-phosphate isomerase-like protein (cupin superfamily)
MPKIINPDEMPVIQSDAGWTVRTVVDAKNIGVPAMVGKWWVFNPNVKSPLMTRGAADELLYVITGSGQAIVGDEIFDLDDESVLWVEEGESYQFIAGDDGLEILQGYAPGDANDGKED